MNILITRLQNIDDMLAFIPALRILRETLPEAKITPSGQVTNFISSSFNYSIITI